VFHETWQLVNNLKCPNIKIDFKVKYILVKDFIGRKKMQKVFNIYYCIVKKTFQIIY